MTKDEAIELMKKHSMYIDQYDCEVCSYHREIRCDCKWEGSEPEDIISHVLDIIYAPIAQPAEATISKVV